MSYFSNLVKQPKDLRHCNLKDTGELFGLIKSMPWALSMGKVCMLNTFKANEGLLWCVHLGG